jgi:hypothetical protein
MLLFRYLLLLDNDIFRTLVFRGMSAQIKTRRNFIQLAVGASSLPLFPRFALWSMIEDERTMWYRQANLAIHSLGTLLAGQRSIVANHAT